MIAIYTNTTAPNANWVMVGTTPVSLGLTDPYTLSLAAGTYGLVYAVSAEPPGTSATWLSTIGDTRVTIANIESGGTYPLDWSAGQVVEPGEGVSTPLIIGGFIALATLVIAMIRRSRK